jgi:branched-chain amino acid transport system substrate-binding protein
MLSSKLKKANRMRFLAVFFFIIAFLPPCNAQTLIGVAGPFNGPFSQLGVQIERGVLAALMGGKVHKNDSFMIEAVDDRCSEDGGRAVAEGFRVAGAKIVIGHPCWRAAVAAADIYAKENILFIGVGVGVARLTDERAGSSVFRLSPRDDALAKTIAQKALEISKNEKIAVYHDTGLYGRPLSEAVIKHLKAQKYMLDTVHVFDATEQSQSDTVKAALETKPDVLVVLGGYADSANLIKALKEAGLESDIIGGDSFAHPEFYALMRNSLKNVFFVHTRFWRDESAARDAVNILEKDEQDTAFGLAVPAYAAGQIVKPIADLPVKDILQTLNSETFETAIGTITFNAKGDALMDGYSLYQWSEAGLPVVATP